MPEDFLYRAALPVISMSALDGLRHSGGAGMPSHICGAA
jgi:hypothetical protein